MRTAVVILLWGMLACCATAPSVAQGTAAATTGSCAKNEFEAVVEGAAASLRDLNARNAPGAANLDGATK